MKILRFFLDGILYGITIIIGGLLMMITMLLGFSLVWAPAIIWEYGPESTIIRVIILVSFIITYFGVALKIDGDLF